MARVDAATRSKLRAALDFVLPRLARHGFDLVSTFRGESAPATDDRTTPAISSPAFRASLTAPAHPRPFHSPLSVVV